ncbi:MAG: transporter ATP-binding protein [Marmoricola sp.]|nr:transporter ATP-binding protein [Marmoricola sp.]
MNEELMIVTDVHKAFGGVKALDGASLSVRRGSTAGLIGPNGAGKSSLFNVITGVTTPDSGQVRFAGADVTGRPLHQVARAGIGRTFQAPRGFASMTVLQNLTIVQSGRAETVLGGLLTGRRKHSALAAQATEVLEKLGLVDLRNVSYTELSGGELRLLEIGRHLMRDIDMLLLDEPTAGVVPAMQERLTGVIKDLAAGGITVLIVEHNLRFVFELAESVDVMVHGRVVASGTPEQIQSDPQVIAAYLGNAETSR